MEALADADGLVFCATCAAPVDEVEEVGGALICLACGCALDGGAPALVHARAAARRGPDDAPPGEGFGVVVGANDSGAVAGVWDGGVGRAGRRALVGTAPRRWKGRRAPTWRPAPPPQARSSAAAAARRRRRSAARARQTCAPTPRRSRRAWPRRACRRRWAATRRSCCRS
jgi:hypothetical protein